MNGIVSVERDTIFDDTDYYRSGGIRLLYNSHTTPIDGVKDGILLEAGFDDVAPNSKLSISSWAYGMAVQNNVDIIDNRAINVICYDPRYTFVEKLQTITTTQIWTNRVLVGWIGLRLIVIRHDHNLGAAVIEF